MQLMIYIAALSAASLSAASFSATGILPPTRLDSNTTEAEVDLVELNHFLDDHGREVFRQVVFFDWSRKNRQFEVRAWRLVKHPSQLPRQVDQSATYLVRWQDKSITRQVRAKSMRETWSQEDPERVNRALLPENQRRPLWPTK
ncbi:hypothetical protein [Stieleria mannarensis]|uniref:hypothetical protein n=1 Tax=Stieleria mannarensis TaxID=2755585 RepID=UPI001600E3F2|nr:hypothetical protein [Rhodopirellula sp. JC639]